MRRATRFVTLLLNSASRRGRGMRPIYVLIFRSPAAVHRLDRA
jgi:hypothetical protein